MTCEITKPRQININLSSKDLIKLKWYCVTNHCTQQQVFDEMFERFFKEVDLDDYE